MDNPITVIPFQGLALVLIPALAVVWILYRWSLGGGIAIYALARMMLQLLAIGYVLTQLFETDSSTLVLIVLLFMLSVASWITIRPVKGSRGVAFLRALAAVSIGGVTTLILVVLGVLGQEPWYTPRVVIPLAGMIFANSMNTTSVAIERFDSEMRRASSYTTARRRAFRAALIPMTNSLLAVGLVSLPGMMTGQILSGVSPMIAVRYQIMVMCMLFGASGISAACYLAMSRPRAMGNRDATNLLS